MALGTADPQQQSQAPDVTKLSDDQLNQMIAQQQGGKQNPPANGSSPTPATDPRKLYHDADLQMQINKLQGQPDSMANMGPTAFSDAHPFKTMFQPVAKTLTGTSLEERANDMTSDRPSTGMDNPITYWAQRG